MKKLFTMCMMLCCVMVAMAQYFNVTTAEGYELKYWGYSDAKTAECRGLVNDYLFAGGSADLVIPETVKYNGVDYTVTSIGDQAFGDCSGFTGSLVIPAGVTSIGDYAFGGCSGFTGSLTIPDGVTRIEDEAFYNCRGFTGSLVIPDGVTRIGDRAFRSCFGFTSSLVIPDGVTSIGADAFYGCGGLSEIIALPTTPPTLGSNVFLRIPVKSISVPVGKKSDYETAEVWKDMPFVYVEIGGEMEEDYYLDIHLSTPNTLWDELDAAGLHPSTVARMKLSGELGADDWALIKSNMSALYDLDMTEVTNTAIPDEAFEESRILHFKFPQGLTSIGSRAFSCSNLCGELVIPDGVTSIGSNTFYECSGFTGSLVIGDGVTSIEYYAFDGCSGFTGSLEIGDGVESIGRSAFEGCSGFTGSLVIGDGVKSIGERAFSGCRCFTGSLVIPAGVTSIGESAFSGCRGFTGSLVIPAGVTSIGGKAFSNCYDFTGSLVIPAGVTNIGDYAFYRCYGFTGKVELPDGLESVALGLFGYCIGIEHVVIPAGVMSIASDAFEGCTALNTLTYHAVNPVSMSENFETIDPQTCILQVPTGAKRTYAMAPVWGNFLNIQEIEVGAPKALVTVKVGTGGVVRYDGDVVVNNQNIAVEEGTTLTLSIAPQAGYALIGITLGGADVMDSYAEGVLTTPAIAENVELKIEFEKVEYEVAMYFFESTGRFVSPQEYGTAFSTIIRAEAGYEVESVTVNGTDVTYSLGADGKLTIENITENKIVLVKTKAVGGTDAPQASSEADFTAWGAQQTIYVETTADMEQVRVIDLKGQVVHTSGVSGYGVERVALSVQGAYVVQVEMKSGAQLVKKLLVND